MTRKRQRHRNAALDEVGRLFSRECAKCGEPYGKHGAMPPHTRGDECPGFEQAADGSQTKETT